MIKGNQIDKAIITKEKKGFVEKKLGNISKTNFRIGSLKFLKIGNVIGLRAGLITGSIIEFRKKSNAGFITIMNAKKIASDAAAINKKAITFLIFFLSFSIF